MNLSRNAEKQQGKAALLFHFLSVLRFRYLLNVTVWDISLLLVLICSVPSLLM